MQIEVVEMQDDRVRLVFKKEQGKERGASRQGDLHFSEPQVEVDDVQEVGFTIIEEIGNIIGWNYDAERIGVAERNTRSDRIGSALIYFACGWPIMTSMSRSNNCQFQIIVILVYFHRQHLLV